MLNKLSQCVCAYLDSSLAMCLLTPSSLPQRVLAMRDRLPTVSSQCVFAYPTCLRNRLRHPMRLRDASVPWMRLRLPRHLRLPVRLHAMRLRNASAPIRPFLTNEPSQCGCVFRSFATLRQDAAMCVYLYIYISTHIHTHTNMCEQMCRKGFWTVVLSSLTCFSDTLSILFQY